MPALGVSQGPGPWAASAALPRIMAQPVSLRAFRPTPHRPVALGPRLTVRAAARRGDRPFEDVARAAAAEASGLQSEALDPDTRRRAEAAISRRGCRVTAGDVAATAGLTLFQAEQALKALAADSLATLAVSDQGEILYCFPPDFKTKIASRSALIRAEAWGAKASKLGAYLLRVAYGTALIASIAIVVTALLVIASSASSRDDRGNRGSGGISPGAFFSYRAGTRLAFDLTDILFFYDPYYYERRRYYARGTDRDVPPAMSFVEAVFSFVFGDGDPNADYDRRRWEAVGAFIASRNGVVTAEELAPFLDLTAKQAAELAAPHKAGVVVDESYVLPVLTRLRGSPEVDPGGRILYRFPALQATGDKRWGASGAADSASARLQRSPEVRRWWSAAKEQPWTVTAAKGGQLLGALALGGANLLGVLWLSAALSSPTNALILARNGLGWVLTAMPALQAYAAAFFAIPAVRWLLHRGRNAAIEARNAARDTAQAALQQPSQEVMEKLAAAAVSAKEKERRVVSPEDSVYRSDRGVASQPIDIEADVWERRLERRATERDLKERGWMPAPRREDGGEPERVPDPRRQGRS